MSIITHSFMKIKHAGNYSSVAAVVSEHGYLHKVQIHWPVFVNWWIPDYRHIRLVVIICS